MDIVTKKTSTLIFAHVVAAVRFGETLAPKKIAFLHLQIPAFPLSRTHTLQSYDTP